VNITPFQKKMAQALFALSAILWATHVLAEATKELNVVNWSDYIAKDTVPTFEKRTGIHVQYDVVDSNETLEAKVLMGNSGFDLAVPTARPFIERQIQAGAYQKLDKTKLSNLKNLNPMIMQKLAEVDPGNQYAVPYMWGTTGIGINAKKVKALLGDKVSLDSWDVIFKPENMKKLAGCGVAILDAPTDLMAISLNYLHKDPHSQDPKDYTSDEIKKLWQDIRPYIAYFHPSQYLNDLANGDICVAVGYSGDILQARNRAIDAKRGNDIQYIIPKEGAVIWIDALVMPKDADHVDNAHAFINYILEPEVVANISNHISYANPNDAAKSFLKPEIANDPAIYPSAAVQATLFSATPMSNKIDRVVTRVWANIKTGR